MTTEQVPVTGLNLDDIREDNARHYGVDVEDVTMEDVELAGED